MQLILPNAMLKSKNKHNNRGKQSWQNIVYHISYDSSKILEEGPNNI